MDSVNETAKFEVRSFTCSCLICYT